MRPCTLSFSSVKDPQQTVFVDSNKLNQDQPTKTFSYQFFGSIQLETKSKRPFLAMEIKCMLLGSLLGSYNRQEIDNFLERGNSGSINVVKSGVTFFKNLEQIFDF